MDRSRTPTEQAHEELAHAFEVLNDRLFDGELPPCLITLQRSRGFRGFFSAHRFIRADATTTHEIAMNPQIFALATLPEVLSELAHNMAHLWAHMRGVQGRRGYHSKAWADRMEALGLMPSSTGRPGGKRTGEKVEHYIIEGGPFDQAVRDLVASGFGITWLDRVASPWLEGEDAGSTEREHQLLGSQLLGRMGLLVSQVQDDEPELDAIDGKHTPADAAAQVTPDQRQETAAEDAFDWGTPGPAATESYVLPQDDDRGAEALPPADGRARPAQEGGAVILDSGSKARAGEEPKPVPLISVGGQPEPGSKPRRDKVRFTCPSCGQKAWAKGTACLDCGTCKVAMASSA